MRFKKKERRGEEEEEEEHGQTLDALGCTPKPPGSGFGRARITDVIERDNRGSRRKCVD